MQNMQNIIWNVFEFAASISGLKKDFCAQKLLLFFSYLSWSNKRNDLFSQNLAHLKISRRIQYSQS